MLLQYIPYNFSMMWKLATSYERVITSTTEKNWRHILNVVHTLATVCNERVVEPVL